MLGTILALQLLAAPSAGDLLAQAAPGEENPYVQSPEAPPVPANPPLPSKKRRDHAQQPAPPPSAIPSAETPSTQATTASAPAAPRTAQLSLLSAEPLGGGGAGLAWAGWSNIGVAYAGGLTAVDDVGGLFDFDWGKTEVRLGAFYRRPLGRAGIFDLGGRLGLNWYTDFGGSWVYSDNHRDRGVELAPALVLSTRSQSGILSLSGELPITITTRYGSGVLFTPRAAASFEAPLYDELTVGVRGALGYRAGSGDAPIRGGNVDVQFLFLAGYRAL